MFTVLGTKVAIDVMGTTFTLVTKVTIFTAFLRWRHCARTILLCEHFVAFCPSSSKNLDFSNELIAICGRLVFIAFMFFCGLYVVLHIAIESQGLA